MVSVVTGGIGFIGSHVCRELLESGRRVAVFDSVDEKRLQFLRRLRMPDISDRVLFTKGDVANLNLVLRTFRRLEAKEIVHAAAITFIPFAIANPTRTFRVNTLGTFNILEASRRLDIEKSVYVSSASVYGDFKYSPANEEHPLEPKDVYGATKAAADRLTIGYHRTYGIPATVIRTTSVYGQGDLENRVVKEFIEKVLKGEPMELHGGGLQRRDFTYVKDAAHGIVLALQSKKSVGRVFNISGGADYSIKHVAHVIKEFIPKAEIKEVAARQTDVARGRLDLTAAKEAFGYEPRYALREGIKEYVDWFVKVYFPSFNLRVKNKPVVR